MATSENIESHIVSKYVKSVLFGSTLDLSVLKLFVIIGRFFSAGQNDGERCLKMSCPCIYLKLYNYAHH